MKMNYENQIDEKTKKCNLIFGKSANDQQDRHLIVLGHQLLRHFKEIHFDYDRGLVAFSH